MNSSSFKPLNNGHSNNNNNTNGYNGSKNHRHTSTLTIPVNINNHGNSIKHGGGAGANYKNGNNTMKQPVNDDGILAHELERMNVKMNELRKSFDDLTSDGQRTSNGRNNDRDGIIGVKIQTKQPPTQSNATSTTAERYYPSARNSSTVNGKSNNGGWSNGNKYFSDNERVIGDVGNGGKHTTASSFATMPRLKQSTTNTYNGLTGAQNNDFGNEFDREIQDFRRNFEDFGRKSTTAYSSASHTDDRHSIKVIHNTDVGKSGRNRSNRDILFGTPDSGLGSSSAANTTLGMGTNIFDGELTGSSNKSLYQVTLDMKEFLPQDIKVKIVDNKLLRVEARMDARTDTGGTVQKEFNREFTLPSNVNTDALVSRIDNYGVMTLEAPYLVSGTNDTVERSSFGRGDGMTDHNISHNKSHNHDFSPNNKYSNSTSRSYSTTKNEFTKPSFNFNKPNKSFFDDAYNNSYHYNPPSTFNNWASGGPASTMPRRKYSLTNNGYGGFGHRKMPSFLDDFPHTPPLWDDFNNHRTDNKFVPSAGMIGTTASAALGLPKSSGDVPFRLKLDLNGYDPDDIKVNVCDNSLLRVQARHEAKGVNGTVSREFNREYTLPAHVDPDTIHSSFSRDGILTIESVATGPAAQERSYIPVKHNNTYKGDSLQNDYTSNKKVFSSDTHHFKDNNSNNNNDAHHITSSSLDNSGITRGTKETPFRLTFDMKDYMPEDIKVKVLGSKLRVEAKHVEESLERGSIIREFSREYVIPTNVEAESLRSSLSNEGVLTVESVL